MRKSLLMLFLLALLLILSNGISTCEEVDLTGTWVGETEVPDSPEPDKLTLVLEKVEGKYAGTISDELGFADEAEIEDVEFKDNELTFSFTIFDGTDYQQVHCSMTVEGNKMSGYWELDDGTSSSVELTKVE